MHERRSGRSILTGSHIYRTTILNTTQNNYRNEIFDISCLYGNRLFPLIKNIHGGVDEKIRPTVLPFTHKNSKVYISFLHQYNYAYCINYILQIRMCQ